METIKDTKTEKIVRFSYFEYVNHAIERKQSSACSKDNPESRQSSDGDWNGTKTFKKAVDLAFGGWDSGIKQMELEGGILADVGITFQPNVVGSVVNMNNYLQGLPENMYEMKQEREYNMPLLTIYVPLAYTAWVSGDQAMNYAKSIVKLVNEKQATHNVRLIGLIPTKQRDSMKFTTEVLIKDYDERFVLNNVAFSFHPAFFRRLWFSHLEGESFWQSGYGSTLEQDYVTKYIKKSHDRGGALIITRLNDIADEGDCSGTVLDKHIQTLIETT